MAPPTDQPSLEGVALPPVADRPAHRSAAEAAVTRRGTTDPAVPKSIASDMSDRSNADLYSWSHLGGKTAPMRNASSCPTSL